MRPLATEELRVLAMDPSTRGFGFVVFEGADQLIDWGAKSVRRNKNEGCLEKVKELIDYYRPDVLVVENCADKDSRRCKRIQRLLHATIELASQRKLRTRRFSRKQVQAAFSEDGAVTKHGIATVISRRFPELAPHLPPYRKPWMSEDYRMNIFDAVAFGVAFFHFRDRRTLPVNQDASLE